MIYLFIDYQNQKQLSSENVIDPGGSCLSVTCRLVKHVEVFGMCVPLTHILHSLSTILQIDKIGN